MEAGNKMEMARILKQYKSPQGSVNYPAVMSVPVNDRIPAMYEKDYMRTTALVGMAIASAFDRMKFKKELANGLVHDIADEVIDSASEDNLSMEDLLLFLQGLVRGKYGNVEDISISRFMNLFEDYRQARHEELLNYRENEHLSYKSLGDSNRSSKGDPLADHFSNLGQSLHELRMSLSESKKESNTIKQANKFYGE